MVSPFLFLPHLFFQIYFRSVNMDNLDVTFSFSWTSRVQQPACRQSQGIRSDRFNCSTDEARYEGPLVSEICYELKQ